MNAPAPALTPTLAGKAPETPGIARQTPRLSGNSCRCPACHQLFRSPRAFDRHRVGRYMPNERRCLTIDEMIGRGMAQDARGRWMTG